MQIRLATEMDLEQLVLLFDEYRQELGQGSDLSRCREFLRARLLENDSMIFIATEGDYPVAFTQVFPSFSSLLLKPLWYLDDLFVLPDYRGQGIAKELTCRARTLAQDANVLAVKREFGELSQQVETDGTEQGLYHALL
ncbi:GNAT family N-acetyltransferase [Shewanella algae]|uniref:GNAT family N-acetyltransferase n=1 Tax=Shewanella algae TaxID=38313 RepID=UPI0012DDF93B|nr:GNAT family N-acetyltransferase [Shewanella algae]QGS59714.1 GNAT family N-acetyltransferase [Shewanella algae]